MAKDELKQTKSVADEHAKQDAEAAAKAAAAAAAAPPPVPENQGSEAQALDDTELDKAQKSVDEKFAVADQAVADLLAAVANLINITTGGPKQLRAQTASNDLAQLRDKLKLAQNMVQG